MTFDDGVTVIKSIDVSGDGFIVMTLENGVRVRHQNYPKVCGHMGAELPEDLVGLPCVIEKMPGYWLTVSLRHVLQEAPILVSYMP